MGGGNAINTTDPGTGVPWPEVARIKNLSGTHVTSGSAIHLGGGYMLTANHVNLSQGYVSFDGTTTFQIDGGSAIQVTHDTDTVDLKLFQLTANPGSLGVNLFPEASKGTEGAFGAATHIGWGIGHNPADLSNPWSWGDSSTSDKRWGVNDFEYSADITYSHAGTDYDYESLVTALDSDATVNEAGATFYDSGSGLIIQDGPDWYLTGITETVSINASSTFAADGSEDLKCSVRVAEYADEITALMTDPIPIPERAKLALLVDLAAATFLLRRRV